MSEFSESYHLRSNSSQDAVDLLRRIGRRGYVFPPANGWVTFVADECDLEADPAIVQHAKPPLLHYMFAEDYGWSYEIFESGECTALYSCSWHDGLETDDEEHSRAKLLQLVPDADAALLDAFEQQVRPTDIDEVMDSEPSKLFARAMRLAHVDWVAYNYVESTMHDTPEEYPGLVVVT